jgi:CHAT domain-containing protein
MNMVLSACDSGVSAVQPGDELMGLSSAMLAMGTASVVAGTIAVPDSATRRLMVELHSRLRAGDRPAQALATARRRLSGRDAPPEIEAVCAGFLCLGAG